MTSHLPYLLAVPLIAALALTGHTTARSDDHPQPVTKLDQQIDKAAQRTIAEGRQIFRYDTSETKRSGAAP